jgi:adenylosuccinate synthase
MPYHIMLDTYREEEKGGTQIGTTKKESDLVMKTKLQE